MAGATTRGEESLRRLSSGLRLPNHRGLGYSYREIGAHRGELHQRRFGVLERYPCGMASGSGSRSNGKLSIPLPFETALKAATIIPADRLSPPTGTPKRKSRPPKK